MERPHQIRHYAADGERQECQKRSHYPMNPGAPAACLTEVRGASLELPRHDQHRLEGAQPKVVVMLLRQLLPSQLIQYCHLLGQGLGDRKQNKAKDMSNFRFFWSVRKYWTDNSIGIYSLDRQLRRPPLRALCPPPPPSRHLLSTCPLFCLCLIQHQEFLID